MCHRYSQETITLQLSILGKAKYREFYMGHYGFSPFVVNVMRMSVTKMELIFNYDLKFYSVHKVCPVLESTRKNIGLKEVSEH